MCQGLGYCGKSAWMVDHQIDSSNYDPLYYRANWMAFYKCQPGEEYGYGFCVEQATRDDLRKELAQIVTVPEK